MPRLPSLVLLVAATACACGDNYAAPDARIKPDAPSDADMPVPRAVAVGTDFALGILSKLDVTKLQITQNLASGAVDSDPVLRQLGDKVYVVNRSAGNNVTIFDARTLAFQEQIGTGAGSNPQDVAVVGNKLYVPAFNGTGVVVLTRGSTAITTIALGTALGDPDGNPNCISAYAVGTNVYVACDLLDSTFTPRGLGKVAVIDTTTDTLATTITLPYANPQGYLVKMPDDSVLLGELVIPVVPDFENYSTGCLARISTGTTPTAGCVAGLGNSDVAGFITRSEPQTIGSNETLWVTALVSASFATTSAQLRKFDLKTGVLAADPVSPSTELITDVAVCPDGSVVAVDKTMNAEGLRVFANGTERTTHAISIGLPPVFSTGIACYDAR